MNRSDSPYLVDWYVVSLRWIILLGTTVSLSLANELITPGSLVLVLLFFWNTILMWLAAQSRRLPYHREIGVAVDLIIATIYFWLAGGLIGPAAWILLLPMLSGSLYFNFIGGISTASVMILVEALDFFLHNTSAGIILIIIGAIATLVLGSLFGYISQQTYNQLQLERKKQITQREKQQEVDTDRLRAIYNMASALTTSLSYNRVLESALELSVNALQLENTPTTPGSEISQKSQTDSAFTSAFLLFQDRELIVGTARRLTQQDLRATFPAKEGILAKVIEEGEPLVTGSITKDPELGKISGFAQCAAIYCMPMRSGYNIYGVMIFGHITPGYFTRERCDILGIVGSQAVIAIQNARLYQDLANEKERMIEVQEESRKKLARDLHDGPTQSISGIAMRVNLVRRMLERDSNSNSAMDELVKIEDLARRTTKEVRHMLFTLRPLVLESQGLTAALQASAEKMLETYAQNVSIQTDETLVSQIEMGKAGVIFYIAEEAVNNARKHANASQIWVRLNPLPQHADIAFLEISDNGVGFDLAEVNKSYDKRGSLGMVNLRERTELVNGVLSIKSIPGKGTKIQVFIPLSEDAADLLHNARPAARNGSESQPV
ncbi:MAG: GAF domain-containing sensor histidine kinase [Chloroflexota bacterium]